MMSKLLESLEMFAINGIFINEISTLAYSDSGKSLCKSIGLEKINKHKDQGDVYWSHITNILKQPFCKNFKTLQELYKIT